VNQHQLDVGDIVRLEFDRLTAEMAEPLAKDIESSLSTEQAVLRPLPVRGRLSEDFGAGAVVLELAISTASGVTSGVITALLTARLRALRPPEAPQVRITELGGSTSARERLRIRIELGPSDEDA
jgi:hypothetical protein